MPAQLKRFLSLSLIGIFTLVMSQVSWGQNQIVDPGFELGITANNPNPSGAPGWAFFAGAGEPFDPNAHSGSFSCYMDGAPGGYYVPGAYQVFAASPGQTYTLSGWVYTPNALVAGSNDFAILQISYTTGAPPSNYAGGTLQAAFGVNVGTPGLTPNVIPPGTVLLPQGVWTYTSVTATAPAGTNSMGAYLLNINADSNAFFLFDDTSLVLNKPGDFNLDGHVNAADISVMEAALANPSAYEAQNHLAQGTIMNGTVNVPSASPAATFAALANVNGSGVINGGQVQALLNQLKTGGGTTTVVPEPSSFILLALAGLGLAGAKKRFSA
jgi:hypothetical protein